MTETIEATAVAAAAKLATAAVAAAKDGGDTGRGNSGCCLAGNAGVMSRIPPPQNDRHADMSRNMSACWRQHVGDIKPCRILRCHVDVMSA